jgi:hypothetical protein
MSRGLSILSTILGLLLLALGLWVTFAFEKTQMGAAYIIQKHPAAEAGGSLVIAGALCLVGAAINNRSREAN